jgi:monoterpene epsilon-lactone hydrolase
LASRELELAIELCRFERRRARPTVIQLGNLAELRAKYEEIASSHLLPPGVNYQPVDAGGVSAEWLNGSQVRDDCAMLYAHGGCYGTGSVSTHRDLMTRLSIETSMRVLGLNYRLAPEHPFPAAVEDTVAAYRWLLHTGIEAARIVVAGDSAGAGLVLALTIALRDDGLPLPGAVVCLSPWVDLALTGESMESKSAEDAVASREMLQTWSKLYLGDRDARSPLASPLYADLRGISPLLIQVGSAEVLLDDSTRLADRASAAGVKTTLEVWPEMIHVWQNFAAILPEGRQAIGHIGRFVRMHLNNH